jgi:hypothetical protein
VAQAVEERAAAAAAQAQAQAQAGSTSHGALRPPPRILVGATALLREGEACGHLLSELGSI